MKKVFLLILFLVSVKTFGQDVYETPNVPYYHDTLTVALDTMDVSFSDTKGIVYVSVSCYTTTGTDTVYVYTQSMDGLIWAQQSVLDNVADTSAAFIIISTTPKEFTIINDSQPWKVRLVSTSNDGSTTVFTLNGKREGL